MTTFNKSLTANQNLISQLTIVRWYTGVFKFLSQGTVRAVYKTVNAITRNRNIS